MTRPTSTHRKKHADQLEIKYQFGTFRAGHHHRFVHVALNDWGYFEVVEDGHTEYLPESHEEGRRDTRESRADIRRSCSTLRIGTRPSHRMRQMTGAELRRFVDSRAAKDGLGHAPDPTVAIVVTLVLSKKAVLLAAKYGTIFLTRTVRDFVNIFKPRPTGTIKIIHHGYEVVVSGDVTREDREELVNLIPILARTGIASPGRSHGKKSTIPKVSTRVSKKSTSGGVEQGDDEDRDDDDNQDDDEDDGSDGQDADSDGSVTIEITD